jgi:fructose-specific phosphotransferase system IIA component
MNLANYLHEDLVFLNLKSKSKMALFEEMVEGLVERKYLDDASEVIELLFEREKLMSTGIKRGFAIPHAFTAQLEHSIMLIGISKEGIDFQALDDELVFFVFLLLGPPDSKQLHMRLLARLSRIMSQDDLYGKLEAATSSAEVLQILGDEERKACSSTHSM